MEEVAPAPLRSRPGGLPLATAAVAIVFAVLAALVAGGRLTTIDHYALVHWMPGLEPSHATHSVPGIEGFVRPLDLETPVWKQLVDLATYPASVLVSVLVFGAGCVALLRRGARTAAVVWVTAFVVANVLEVFAKVAIEKPAL